MLLSWNLDPFLTIQNKPSLLINTKPEEQEEEGMTHSQKGFVKSIKQDRNNDHFFQLNLFSQTVKNTHKKGF